MADTGGRGGQPSGGFAALAITAMAVACCAAVPVVAALAGGVAIGTLLGVGAGLAATILLGAWANVHRRR